jgi:hypothetical protein
MRTKSVVLSLATVIALMAVSAKGENGLEQGTHVLNPITLEGQIQEVRAEGDDVIFRLYRQPYDFVAVKWLCVELTDGRKLYARDLQERDYLHLDGDLDHKTIYANRIVLLRREEHIGAH